MTYAEEIYYEAAQEGSERTKQRISQRIIDRMLLPHIERKFGPLEGIDDVLNTIKDEELLYKIQDLLLDSQTKEEFLDQFRILVSEKTSS